MIRNRLKLLAVAAVAFGVAACGGSDSTGPEPNPAPQSGTIRLLNESNATIISVQIAKCSDPEWGPNRLGASETLAPGALRSWTFEPGCYDLRASTGSKSATWYDRELAPGGAVQLAVPAAVGTQ